jgi:hypothetical protein
MSSASGPPPRIAKGREREFTPRGVSRENLLRADEAGKPLCRWKLKVKVDWQWAHVAVKAWTPKTQTIALACPAIRAKTLS